MINRDINPIARIQNSRMTSPDDALVGLLDPRVGERVAHTPATANNISQTTCTLSQHLNLEA